MFSIWFVSAQTSVIYARFTKILLHSFFIPPRNAFLQACVIGRTLPRMAEQASNQNALNLKWSFGFSGNVTGAVHSLATASRPNALFYVSSHTGVIHDTENDTQHLLQGHVSLFHHS